MVIIIWFRNDHGAPHEIPHKADFISKYGQDEGWKQWHRATRSEYSELGGLDAQLWGSVTSLTFSDSEQEAPKLGRDQLFPSLATDDAHPGVAWCHGRTALH